MFLFDPKLDEIYIYMLEISLKHMFRQTYVSGLTRPSGAPNNWLLVRGTSSMRLRYDWIDVSVFIVIPALIIGLWQALLAITITAINSQRCFFSSIRVRQSRHWLKYMSSCLRATFLA